MPDKVKPVPEGYHNVTPYLVLDGAARAIDFYRDAFGATELMRMPAPGGKIGHAEIKIGDSHVMLADAVPEQGHFAPQKAGSSPVGLLLYVDDVDRTFEKAVSLGATVAKPLKNEFYGDRMGTLHDPFGHTWHLATHVEDVSPEEMEKRMAALAPA